MAGLHYKGDIELKTGVMSNHSSKSEEVVEGYKRHKLSASALREIHRLLQEFEQARAADKRIAVIGVIVMIALLAAAVLYIFVSS